MTQKPESLTCGCEPLSVYLVSAERCRYFAAVARINALRSEIAALQSDHQLFYAATIAREQELREDRDALLEALKELRAHNWHDHGCGHEKNKLDELLARRTAKGEGL